MRSFSLLLLLMFSFDAHAWDCDVGVYPGLYPSNGIVANATCGKRWRLVLGAPITHDNDEKFGFKNNSYDYMVGVGFQHRWKKFRFDLAWVYINEETALFDQRKGPIWIRVAYEILPSWHCSIVHSSVVFVDDSGRNQIGCDYTFRFE